MRKMVIAYFPDGSMEHTLKDSLFRPGGEGASRTVERMTEILPTDDGNGFFIRFMKGYFAGRIFTGGVAQALCSDRFMPLLDVAGLVRPAKAINLIYVYPTYEAAVEAEITIMDALRRHGMRVSA